MFSRSISENGVQALSNEHDFLRNFTVASDSQSGDCRKLNRRLGELTKIKKKLQKPSLKTVISEATILDFYRTLINGMDPEIQETIQEHHDKMLPDKRNRILEEETRRLEFSLKLAFCQKKWSR